MDFSLYSISLRGFFNKSYEVYNDDYIVLRAEKVSFFGFGDYDLFDTDNKMVLSIRKPFHLYITRFELIEEGEKVAQVRAIPFSKSFELTYDNVRLEASGNFFNTEFTLKEGTKEIAKISRDFWGGKKAYQIGIMQGYDELYILAMIICISIALRMRKSKS